MIEALPRSSGKVLGVRLTGKVTEEEYEKVFLPALDDLIKKHGKIRCLYFIDEGFEGWELLAMRDGAKFGLKHRNDFEKFAVIAGQKWAEWASKIAAHLIPAEMKTYTVDQLEEAWSWLEA